MIDMGEIYFVNFTFFIIFIIFRSQYFDNDGDRAHEFWQEEMVEDRAVMVRQSKDLRPEG